MVSKLRVGFSSAVGGYMQPLDSLLLPPPPHPPPSCLQLLRIRNGGMETEDVEGAKLAG